MGEGKAYKTTRDWSVSIAHCCLRPWDNCVWSGYSTFRTLVISCSRSFLFSVSLICWLVARISYYIEGSRGFLNIWNPFFFFSTSQLDPHFFSPSIFLMSPSSFLSPMYRTQFRLLRVTCCSQNPPPPVKPLPGSAIIRDVPVHMYHNKLSHAFLIDLWPVSK